MDTDHIGYKSGSPGDRVHLHSASWVPAGLTCIFCHLNQKHSIQVAIDTGAGGGLDSGPAFVTSRKPHPLTVDNYRVKSRQMGVAPASAGVSLWD